jgi:flagellar hook-length control protein FliK
MDSLDSKTLGFMEKLLDKVDDMNEKNPILDKLLAKVSDKLEKNNTTKTLSLEEILSKNKSDNEEASSNNSENKNDTFKAQDTEDKFLNKLLGKDSGNDKINMFSFRTSLSQVQNSNNVQAVTDINKVTFVDDLIKDIKFMSTNSLKELIVKVNPGNLGEITIKVAEENGILKAHLKASSKETTELMAANISEIKKQLSEQNLKIADVNIELYQDDTTFFKEKNFQGNMQDGGQSQNDSKEVETVISGNEQDMSLEEENIIDENQNVNFLA